ncbi:MalY/PatB family protein [Georgenia sp. Z1344]|uniref:MalY/PatB family protein n=1 Tax=Georgenia sp. Z1344 TaxID=3416706 RepID=UPI003CF70359
MTVGRTTAGTSPTTTNDAATAGHAAEVAALRALRGRVSWQPDAEAYGSFIAESDLGTAPAVVEALHRAVDAQLFGYLSPGLIADCVEATAAFRTRQHGVEIDPDQVRLLPDVLSAMHELIRRLPAGARVVLPTPAYPMFFAVAERRDVELVEVPMTRDGASHVLDLDAIWATLRPGDLFVLCNPQNPTGRVHTRAELEALAEVVDRSGATVFADEIHASLVRPGHVHVPYASLSPVAAAHSVTATSASKSFNLPGLRCAQLIASTPEAARGWDTHAAHLPKECSTPGVLAVTAAYTDADDWLAGLNATIDSRHDLLARLVAERLPEAVVAPAEGTYLGWVDLRAYGLGDSPALRLREHGVLPGDGPSFGVAAAGHVRLTLATSEAILTEIVDRIATACLPR